MDFHSQEARYQNYNQQGCIQGTQETILEVIQLWANDSNVSPIFWLNGLTGIGKSTIAQSVVKWCGTINQLGLSFFCPHNPNDYNNPHLILTLATQLAMKHSRAHSALVSLLQSDPGIIYKPLFEKMEMIANLLKLVDTPTIIVIDALDDWMDDESQSAFLSALEYWIMDIPKAKFLITSQPKPHLLDSFHFPLYSGIADGFTLDNTMPDLVNHDIRVFLEHELSGLAEKNGLDNWPTITQLDLLCNRTAGHFAYAVATVKFLSNASSTPSKQYAVIEHHPDDTIHEGTVEGVHRGLSLDSLCTSTFQAAFKNNNAEDDALVRSVLAAVVLTTHPIPPSAIADLTCLEAKEVMSLLESMQSLLRLQEDPDRPVQPFHKLLSDLLTSPTRCTDERFYISPGKFHYEIALNCLRLMNETLRGDLAFRVQDTTDPDSEHPRGRTAFEYACTSWHIHLSESRGDFTTLIPALRHFLEEVLTAWLKVLENLDADPVFALNKTISWLREVCLGLL